MAADEDDVRIDALLARIADGERIDGASEGATEDASLRRAQRLARLLGGVRDAASDEVAKPEATSASSAPRREDRLGPYRLLRLLGEGGMGEVWLGERCDGQVEQRVAIKRVRGAARLSMLRHLLRERRILARLNHPNIAHFLGADVDAGEEPYLVIEYVEGVALDQYCRDRRASLGDRLRLFLAICAAVEHAHRHLVVHRDLKPANVLVTAEGIPKLLDFGIARLIEDSGGGHTQTGLLALTPRYAAPEQFAGDEVTPGVDQYALGLILHELLTGQLPSARLDGHVARIAAAVEAGDPPAASSTMPIHADWPISADQVRGDLDAIIARCLRREPLQRYGSVAELAADVRRHLASEAVLARGEARGYRLRRFLSRHRFAFALSSLALVAILAALITALLQASRARVEAEAATAARDSAEAVNDFLTDMLSAPSDATRGANTRVAELLDTAAARVAGDASLNTAQRVAIHFVLARSYDSLGREDAAVAQAEAGLKLAGNSAALRESRLALLQQIAQIEALRCRLAAAERTIDSLRREAQVAGALAYEADAAVAAARVADCRDDYALQQQEADRAIALVGGISSRAFDTYSVAVEQSARAAFALGRADVAQQRLLGLLANWPDRPELQQQWVSTRHLLLQVTAARGDLTGAEQIARENLARLEPRHGTDPHPSTLSVRSALASILFDRGEYSQSLAENDTALAHATALYGAESEQALMILANRANALKALGRYDEAEAGYRQVIAALDRAKGTPSGGETRLIHAFNLLELLNERQRFDEAKTHGEALFAEAERVLGRDHIVSLEAGDALGVTALGLGDAEQAEVLHRAAVAAKQRVLGEDSPYTATARYRRGLALAKLGRGAEAREEITAAVATRRAALGAEHPDTRAAERALAALPR